MIFVVIVFDGRKLAEEIKRKLVASGNLNGKKLLIIQADGKEQESTYVGLKHKTGEYFGVVVTVVFAKSGDEVKEKLKQDLSIFHGVMVQLPIIGASVVETNKILSLIPLDKDVDGLNPKSRFVPSAIVAIEKILNEAQGQGAFYFDIFLKVGVVGALGMVGKRVVVRLRELGYVVCEFDKGDDLSNLKNCDVIVSAVGKEGLIKPEMVSQGFVAIDLGYPKGDFDAEALKKAAFYTPVPGGVGPVTVISLFENLA